MLEVQIENILPVTEARDSFNQLVDKVEGADEMYVMTKNGKPAAILVGVHHLEKLTGTSHEKLMEEVASSDTTAEAPADTAAEDATATETPATAATTDTTADSTVDVNEPATPVAPEVVPADPAPASPFSYDNTTNEMSGSGIAAPASTDVNAAAPVVPASPADATASVPPTSTNPPVSGQV